MMADLDLPGGVWVTVLDDAAVLRQVLYDPDDADEPDEKLCHIEELTAPGYTADGPDLLLRRGWVLHPYPLGS